MITSKILALSLISLSVLSARADEVLWPIPTPPAGTNPAAFPSPRLDWLEWFQNHLNEAKGKSFDLILDGDSITDGWRGKGKAILASRLAKYNVIDFGIGGDRTENVLWRLKEGQVDGLTPKLVMLMIGTNNLGNTTDDQIADAVAAIVTDYEKRLPSAHILLLGIFPRSALAKDPVRARIMNINGKLAALPAADASHHLIYLDMGAKFLEPDGSISPDMMSDFLHPNEKGYVIWADAVQPVLDKYFPNVPSAPTAPAAPSKP